MSQAISIPGVVEDGWDGAGLVVALEMVSIVLEQPEAPIRRVPAVNALRKSRRLKM